METITTKSDHFGKLSISENRRYLMEGDKPVTEDMIRLLLASGTTMPSVRRSLARTIGNMLIEIFPIRL